MKNYLFCFAYHFIIKLVWPPFGLDSAARTVWRIAHAPDDATTSTCVLLEQGRNTNHFFGLSIFLTLEKICSTFQSGNILRMDVHKA